jgi:hypothetical protein
MVYLPDENPRWRFIMIAFYFCFIVAGVLIFAIPSRAIRVEVPTWSRYLWALFFITGGLLCMVGTSLKTTVGGLIGLPLLSSASALYGVSLCLQYEMGHDGAYLVVGTLLIGLAFSLLDRWVGTREVFRAIQGARDGGSD